MPTSAARHRWWDALLAAPRRRGRLVHDPCGADRSGAGWLGITCAYALEATTLLSSGLELVNGLHRWAVALELGIGVAPVKMVIETEPVWA